MNNINQANPGINSVTTAQSALNALNSYNPLNTGFHQNRLSSDLSGLYSYANQIRNNAYQQAAYNPAYPQSVGMLTMPQSYATSINMLRQNSTSDLSLLIAAQATLENQSQLRRGNIGIHQSDFLNRSASNNPIIGSVLGQMTMHSSNEGSSTSGLAPTFSNVHRLEQLAQLRGHRTDPNALATLGSSTTPQLIDLQLNVDRIMQNSSPQDSSLRAMGFTNGIQGQTNNLDSLEALRSVLSMLQQQAQNNNPTNFRR